MPVKVLQFADRKPKDRNWSNAELAELYRVEHALVQAGIALETACGMSDEGDPWYVFCRRQGDVLVHITRYDGFYHLYSPALRQPLTGVSFSALTKSFVSGLRTPVVHNGSVAIHPAALLSVVVAAIFYAFDFHSHSAKAAPESEREGQSSHFLPDSPTSDALNHTFLGSVTAFCSRAEEAVGSVLAKVEAAAILVASAVAVLADYAYSSAVDSEADHAAIVAVAEHQDRVTDQHAVGDAPSLSEQHSEDAGSERSQLAPTSDGLAATTPDTSQTPPTVATVTASPVGIGNDKASMPSSELSPAQLANFGYGIDTVTAQPDSGASAKVVSASAVTSGAAVGLHDNADGLPGALAGQQGDNPDGGQHGVVNITLADGDAASISGEQNVTMVNVNLAGGGGSIDLSGASGVSTVTIAGDGSLMITGFASLGSPEIVMAAHSDVSLTFGTGSDGASSFIKLSGEDQLSLTDAPNMSLTLDSGGGGSNKVAIAASTASSDAALNLTIVGIQDLLLQESATAFDITQIQSSGFSGNLTVGLDLQNTAQAVDLSKVNAASFIVGDDNSAVLVANSGASIQLDSNVSNVEASVAGATAAASASLAFDLNNGTGQPAAELINLLEPVASNVSINSTAAGATGVNTIATLSDPSLSVLTLTGESPLTISAIAGPTIGNSQSITVDAHQLTGALNLDVSGIAESSAGGGSITIIGGSGWNVLTNLNTATSTTFILGPGENTITVGAGSISDVIDGLTASTGVCVGSAAYFDNIVGELNAGTNQALIDGQTSLVAAAQTASNLAGLTVAHQAVLFSYNGTEYAFIDANGSHVFNSASDSIIKLIGISPTADLAGVFHSA